MKRPKLLLLVMLLSCSLSSITSKAFAQYGLAEVSVNADIDGNDDLYASTETYSFDAEGYYDNSTVDATIIVTQGYTLVDAQTNSDEMDAFAAIYATSSPGQTYNIDGYGDYCTSTVDTQSYGYSEGFASDGSGYGNGQYCANEGLYNFPITAAPAAPNIDSSAPSSATAGDNNVTINIYGENLTNSDGSPASLGFWPNGQVTFNNVQAINSGQLTATYSIDPSVTPVLGGISVQTDGGTSYGPDFEIDAAPVATVTVSPATWQAGTTQSITISGSNWGANPVATIDVSDIALNVGPDPAGSGNLTGTVTVPANETATTADITVSFSGSGCTGNCYTNSNGQNSTSPQPGSASASINPATCPQTITLDQSQLIQMPLTPKVPGWLTGIGILTPMQLGPNGTDYTNAQVTENVSTVSNSCNVNPTNTVFGNPCISQVGAFKVGSGGTGIDNITPALATQNVIWDQHYT